MFLVSFWRMTVYFDEQPLGQDGGIRAAIIPINRVGHVMRTYRIPAELNSTVEGIKALSGWWQSAHAINRCINAHILFFISTDTCGDCNEFDFILSYERILM
jgi:hypothetical protein